MIARVSGLLICAIIFAVAFPIAARPSDYPARPVRIIVPYAAGGGVDAVARIMAQELSNQGGQFVIENITGGGGAIAAVAASRAPADGYTLMVMNQDFVIRPLVKTNSGYDPQRNFVPISLLASGIEAIVVNPALPATSMQELITLLRANPGKYSYATPGYATSPHLAGERLFRLTHGLDVIHVPFQGGFPAITATVAGHTHILHVNLSVVTPYIRDGKLRLLAVANDRRSPNFPHVPTLAEAGVPHHEVRFWIGLVAPAGTPDEIITRLHGRVGQAIAAPSVREKLMALGLDPLVGSPEAFTALLTAESAQWARLVRSSGIKID